jgi:hypothetical protein
MTSMKKNSDIPEIVKRAMTESVTDIGQLTTRDKYQLNKFVKRGALVKGLGGQYPNPKTVYAIAGFNIAEDRIRQINQLHIKSELVYNLTRQHNKN